MKAWVKYSIVGVVLVLFILLLYWINTPPSEEQLKAEADKIELEEKKKKVEEKKKLKKEEEERKYRPIPINPYGTYLVKELYKSYDKTKKLKPMRSPIATNLPKKSTNGFPNIYMLVGDGIYLSYDDVEELIDFVEVGNSAFLAISDMDYAISERLFGGDGYYLEYDSCAHVSFTHDSLKEIEPRYRYMEGTTPSSYQTGMWSFWNTTDLVYSDYAVISYADLCSEWNNKRHPICIRIKMGEGYLFLHSQPESFTNEEMMTLSGLEHAERIFSNVPKGNVYWHELFGSNSSRYLARKDSGENSGNRSEDINNFQRRRESPLQFILNSASLRWGLYLLLIALLIYIIFQSKRRRKIVPAAEKRSNSSLEFANTVGQLYYQERRHDKLIRHQETQFMSFIRTKYYMPGGTVDTTFMEALERKSGVPKAEFEPIFKAFAYARKSGNVSDNFLLTLQQNIESFYKKCN